MSAPPLPPDYAFLDLLRGNPAPATAAWHSSALYQAARREGLLPLVVDRLARQGWNGIREDMREALERERRAAIALATVANRDLAQVLHALHSSGIEALVLKGAALAHTHYTAPWLRPRIDADLLVRRADVDAVHAVFRAMGAAYLRHVTGEHVMSQFHYVRADTAGCRHVYDVHWRIANPAVFAQALSYDEMAGAAVRIPALGERAHSPGPVHALLLAGIHRAAHHGGKGPLVWLFDVHLMAGALDEQGCRMVAAEAMSRRIAAVTAATAAAAHAAFAGRNTALIADLLAGAGRDEPSARFLVPRTRAMAAIDELRSLDGTRARLRLAREWLLPPAVYMRGTYAPGSWWPLPALYLVRAVRGAIRWCRSRPSGSEAE